MPRRRLRRRGSPPRRRGAPRPPAQRPTCRSYGGASDGDPADPDVALSGPDRRRLATLAAETGLHLEVGPDSVDPLERLQAVADQGRAAAWLGHLAALDQIALRDAEDEVAGGRLDLAAAERDGVEAVVDLRDHRLGV